jgi:hypothetical protein
MFSFEGNLMSEEKDSVLVNIVAGIAFITIPIWILPVALANYIIESREKTRILKQKK